MAFIPLKQTVTISPFTGLDPDYNEPQYGEDYALKCRFDEGIRLVRNQHGEEVVSTGAFLFDKLAAIGISDLITFTNELGTETTYDPLAIAVIRDFSGRPLLTEVSV
ncbi:hypothetical protein D3C81_1432830 [compost metagenome]